MGLVEIVSAIGNVASTVGRGASSVGRISAEVPVSTATISGLGRLSALGSRMAGPILPVVNEGPVIGGLEMFKPIAPIGQINFKQNQSELNPADAVLEAQSILAQVRLQPKSIEVPEVFQTGLSDMNLDPDYSEPVSETVEAPRIETVAEAVKIEASQASDVSRLAAVRETITLLGKSEYHSPMPILNIDKRTVAYPKEDQLTAIRPFAKPAAETEEALATEVGSKPQTESRVSSQTAQIVSTPITPEQLVEVEELEEDKQLERREEDIKELEDVNRVRVMHVIDKHGVVRRIRHFVGALVAVLKFKQGKKNSKDKGEPIKIKGSEAASLFLPSNNQQVRGGEVNRKDPEGKVPDKTMDATVEEISKLEFTSEEEIKQRVPETVEDNHPVEVATEGKVASVKNIANSHEYIGGRSDAIIEFEERKRLKEQQKTVVIKREEVVTEGTIQDHLDLAQALQAA